MGRQRSEWRLRFYQGAGEASGHFWQQAGPPSDGGWGGEAVDPARSSAEAGRRARGMVRRYCAANRLNRLGTLTYRDAGCHVPAELRSDLGAFFRRLRRGTAEGAFPYLWVPEWHPKGHGLHAHFAVGRFLRRAVIERAWGYGFVHIKLLGDLPIGSGSLQEARAAARYLSKYVSKSLDERGAVGLHRYEVAQGFQPSSIVIAGRSAVGVVADASAVMGAAPSRLWSSRDAADWYGPPAVWAQW